MTDTKPELVEEMFVQVAPHVVSDGDRMSLLGPIPSTLYFSDRPERVVGHMTTEQFVDLWDDGDDSFAADPPNAVLAFADGDDTPSEAVVILRDPRIEEDGVSYAIEVLEGTVPTEATGCTLFIDPLGRPLSPVSVAGVRRRERRRVRRRF